MTIELIHLADVTYTVREFIDVGAGPGGRLTVGEMGSAVVDGERLRGRMKGLSGGDWVRFAAGIGSLDVRFVLETHDGALVYIHYEGRMDLSGGIADAVGYAAPMFQTADSRYTWLNSVVAVGKARFADPTTVLYEWYEVR